MAVQGEGFNTFLTNR